MLHFSTVGVRVIRRRKNAYWTFMCSAMKRQTWVGQTPSSSHSSWVTEPLWTTSSVAGISKVSLTASAVTNECSHDPVFHICPLTLRWLRNDQKKPTTKKKSKFCPFMVRATSADTKSFPEMTCHTNTVWLRTSSRFGCLHRLFSFQLHIWQLSVGRLRWAVTQPPRRSSFLLCRKVENR